MLNEGKAFLNGLTLGSSKAVSNDCGGAVNSSSLIKAQDKAIEGFRKIPLVVPK